MGIDITSVASAPRENSPESSSRPSPQASLFAGLVSGMLVVTFELSLATLIFPGALGGWLSAGIGILLVSAVVIGTIVSVRSSYLSVIAVPQEETAVIVALMAAGIVSEMKKVAPGSDTFPTVVAAIAVTSLVTGAFFMLLGRLHLGKIVRYVPYPVVAGFLAGVGWLLIQGSVSVMSGNADGLPTIATLWDGDFLLVYAPGAAFTILFTIIFQRYQDYRVQPLVIAGAIALLYGVSAAAGHTPAMLLEHGRLLGPFPAGNLWPPISLSSLSEINWVVLARNVNSIMSVTVMATISVLLSASGVEVATDQEIDLERIGRINGIFATDR